MTVMACHGGFHDPGTSRLYDINGQARNRLRTEVPIPYKVDFSGLNFREYPPKIWPEIWYVYVPPSVGSWRSPIDDMFMIFSWQDFQPQKVGDFPLPTGSKVKTSMELFKSWISPSGHDGTNQGSAEEPHFSFQWVINSNIDYVSIVFLI